MAWGKAALLCTAVRQSGLSGGKGGGVYLCRVQIRWVVRGEEMDAAVGLD